MNLLVKYTILHTFLIMIFDMVQPIYINGECRSLKLKGCFCGKAFYYDKEQFVANCTGLGLTDTAMLSELPEETEALIFTGNKIRTLPWNVFGNMSKYSKLRIVDMSNNDIHEIKGKTYHHVENVETLILNHNNIVISETESENYHHPRMFSNFVNLRELHLTNAFADNTDAELAEDLHDIFMNSDLKFLYKLHLEQNEIRFFKDPNVFCDLPDLRQLYLGMNYLSSVSFNLRCLKLEFLDLEENNMTRLSADDFDSFDTLVVPDKAESFTVDLRGNPFQCDKAMGLYNWLKRTKVTIRNKNTLECHTTKFGNKYVVNLQELGNVKETKLPKAITVVLVILVLILVALLSAYGYMHKDKIRARMSPVLDVVSRKVHYTTIDSQIV